MNFTPIILETAAAGQQQSTGSALVSMLITFLPIILIFYFLILRPQKKREKEEKAMRESIAIGDEIVTIGGIIGLVVRQTEDTLVIETGGDRSKLRIQKAAVRENLTALERKQAAAAAEKKAVTTSPVSPEVTKKEK
ncbi:MAG: preprotein translocase subunit YajC [Oscillospiraceae bacterium]|nr:preprotein translocase subunit YajC [Oscillospiraceae bacterium]